MKTIDSGFVLAVLAAGEGTDYASYSRRYFSGEAVSADGDRSIRLDSGSDTPADFPVPPPPPLLHLEAAGDQTSAEQREYLDRRLPLALRAFRQRCPILPDEVLVEASIGALLEPWCGLAPGTMTYVRKTNFGTVAFAIAGMTVDIQTGMTSYPQTTRTRSAALAGTRSAALAGPAQMDADTKEEVEMLVDSALTTAQFVGFAFPPYGLILSGGAAILQMIFGKLMSGGSKVSLAQTVSDVVKKTVVDLDLQKSHAEIVTVYEWFTTYYDAAYDGEIQKTDEEYKDFKTHLNNHVAGDSNFRPAVNTLKESAYNEKGFPLFLLSTSLLLLLLKVKLLIDSSAKSAVDTIAYTDLMHTLTNSIAHANTIAPKNKQTIETALGKIPNVYRVRGVCIGTIGGTACEPNRWVWTEANGNLHRYDDTLEGGCTKHTVEQVDKAGQERHQYYAKYQQALFAQYGNPEKVSKIIAAWTKAQQDYAAAKAKSA